MRPVILGRPAQKEAEAWRKWADECFAEIERASQDDIAAIAQDFTVTNHTPTRSLDAGTAALGDLVDFVCTFIEDLQKRGSKRNQ